MDELIEKSGDGFGGRSREIEARATDVLLRYLDSDGRSKALLNQAKVAAGALATASRNRQTAGARDALTFAMARSIAANPLELAEYIRVTQPHSALVAAIPEKTE